MPRRGKKSLFLPGRKRKGRGTRTIRGKGKKGADHGGGVGGGGGKKNPALLYSGRRHGIPLEKEPSSSPTGKKQSGVEEP